VPISQTVGEIAQAMLTCYFDAAKLDSTIQPPWPRQPDGAPPQPDIVEQFTIAFDKYWTGRENRPECASWLAVKMDRASRRITPIQSECRVDITRVIDEINRLPITERALTLLYVLHEGWWTNAEDRLAPESTVLDALKQFGPADTLRFLQRQQLSNDPDLEFGDYAHNKNETFVSMANFILRNATTLLRPTDADALLACEQAEQAKLPSIDREVSTCWSAAAAELTAPSNPAHASEILHAALLRFPAGSGSIGQEEAQSVLISSLWKLRGATEGGFIANWFYDSILHASDVQNGPVSLLRLVQSENADPKGLLATLVADPRFDHTDWETLQQMLTTDHEALGIELVSQREIYNYQPNSYRADQTATLAAWRNDLRKQFGLAEIVIPVVAQPQKILTTPDKTIALTAPAVQLAISPDGQYLATLAATQSRPAAEIINTITGNIVWMMPAPARSAWRQIAFTANPREVLLLDSLAVASVGNIATQKVTRRSGRFPNGDAMVYNNNSTHSLIADPQGLVLTDLADGQVLWRNSDRFRGLNACIALAPGDSLAVAGGSSQSEKIVTLYDGATGAKLREITDFSAQVCAVGFAGDSRTLVTATAGTGIQVWDTTTGKLEREIVYPVKEIRAGTRHPPMALSPDGRWVAVIGLPPTPLPADKDEYPVGIFDLSNGELRWEIRSTTGNARLVFSPDGKTLYTAGDSIQVWKLMP